MRSLLLALPLCFVAAIAGAQHAGHGHARGSSTTAAPSAPREPGQSAFAAIAEIVALLEADPATDWARVDVEALRRHLVDMDNVTLHATVASEAVPEGMRFMVSGLGEVRESIRRMVVAHAATMNGQDGWRFAADETPDGATMTVSVPPADRVKLRALGFIGVMTRGMHHQAHHLAIARGAGPHR